MRFTLISTSILLAATRGYARGTLGFALGTKNADGSCKQISDYEADFDAIRTNTGSTLVRGYAASDCDSGQNMLAAAQTKGFKVVLGIWPDTDDSFSQDKLAVAAYAPKYPDQVYAVTVGSETLYRGTFTGEQLLGKINDVKSIVPNVKVGTADSYNKYADGTADALITGGVQLLMANAFPYWQGKIIGAGATETYFSDIQQALGYVVSRMKRGLRFMRSTTTDLCLGVSKRCPARWIPLNSGMERRDGRLLEEQTTQEQ
jgi:glucan 1,3-beta-glucosidase